MSHVYTATGVHFNVENPEPQTIRAWDFAWGQYGMPRFACQNRLLFDEQGIGRRWDVLSHVGLCVVIGSQIVPDWQSRHELRAAILLHDATEAYLGEIVYAVKELLPDYKALEDNLARHIFSRFRLEYDGMDWDTIHRIDRLAGSFECDYFDKPMSVQARQRLEEANLSIDSLPLGQPRDYIAYLKEHATHLDVPDMTSLFVLEGPLAAHLPVLLKSEPRPARSRASESYRLDADDGVPAMADVEDGVRMSSSRLDDIR
jgi:hypothetical protein